MPVVEESIDIDKPRAEVFVYAADSEHLRHWASTLYSVQGRTVVERSPVSSHAATPRLLRPTAEVYWAANPSTNGRKLHART